MSEGFSRWARQIFAGILDVFQENLTMNSAKSPGQAAFNACDYSFKKGQNPTSIYDTHCLASRQGRKRRFSTNSGVVWQEIFFLCVECCRMMGETWQG